MLVNERIGHNIANYLANDSQSLYGAQYGTKAEVAPTNLAPNANFSTHDSISYTTPSFGQTNEKSARYANTNNS